MYFWAVGLGAQELMAAVHAWQSGALSRDSLMDLFRRGEILPAVRTNAEEANLIEAESPKSDGTEPNSLTQRALRPQR